jgi:hypothetical protein
MSRWMIYIFLTISFLLVLFIGGGQYWLKRLESKENSIEKNKIVCEFNGKTYQQDEGFIIRLDSGCSLCVCGKDGIPVCNKTYCPIVQVFL